jgi:archaellum biogenesis protein FlaJ (TadC family)
MSHKDKVSLLFVLAGLISGIALSFALPEEKLIIALSAPSALIGAGLAANGLLLLNQKRKINEDN